MGRFSVETSSINSRAAVTQTNRPASAGWPSVFTKEAIGIEIPGVIVEDKDIITPSDLKIIGTSLTAVRDLRLKGYKVFLFFNEPLISSGRLTTLDVNDRINHLMQIFGQAGIFSIEGILYSTSNFKDDMFAFPNNGMLKKAEDDFNLKFKGGYFISNNLSGLKVGASCGAKPILIKSSIFPEVEQKLDTFANRELKSKVKTYDTLFNFVSDFT